jgi:hypothetical protein
MPYFYDKEKNINILFIHIPKTGGTSIEYYFSKKYNIPLNEKSLYNIPSDKKELSLQHHTYRDIIKKKINITFDKNLKILSVVRNPYTRIISDLFYFKKININTTPDEVYKIIKNDYIKNPMLDNHYFPQYKYLIDKKNKLINNLILLKTENLTKNMKKIGYNDFDIHENKNNNNINYYKYLNKDRIRFINKYYNKDFEFFKYKKRVENDNDSKKFFDKGYKEGYNKGYKEGYDKALKEDCHK